MLMLGFLIGVAQAGANYPAYSIVPLSGVTIPGLPAVTSHICVDQFGYRPDDKKVAVISDPQKGYNAFDRYTPGIKLVIRNRAGKDVYSGTVAAWKNGEVHEDSGDRGWWFDFSALKTPGEYYIFDPNTRLRSPVFKIGEKVFTPILTAATRMFYFQRLATPIAQPYTEGPWVDKPAFMQDRATRSVEDKENKSLERDMSGGWMDAGDTDKYPPFNGDVIHPLLYAYRANPRVFSDESNIPESKNRLPDLLDEIKYQLDWLLKMQFPDGSVPVKMGDIDYNGKYPLSSDTRTRYYGPKDSSAAIYTSAIFAHAARVYRTFPAWKAYAETLHQRALLGWNWYQTHPRTFKSDTGEIKSGIANRTAEEQDRMECYAAIHLFALSGDEKYQEVIRKKVGATRQLSENVWSPYETGASEALVDYMRLPKADPIVTKRIVDQLTKSATSDQFAPAPETDLYRAWMEKTNYHWGSNTVRSNWGVAAILAAKAAKVDAETKRRLLVRAEDMLHSFHGVNPFGVVYLTNMGRYGAEHSLKAIYHARYGVGTLFSFNPPPAYVVGGPNQSVTGKAADGKPSIAWIKEQPRGKAYADFDLGWPESSWELSEPAIYYQAIYIRLLAEFAR